MLGIKRLDFIRKEEVLNQVHHTPLVKEIHHRQLKCLGHILRRPQPQHGKRKPGRPKTMFHQHIAKVINSEHPLLAHEIRRAAKDRKQWRKIVTDCRRLSE